LKSFYCYTKKTPKINLKCQEKNVRQQMTFLPTSNNVPDNNNNNLKNVNKRLKNYRVILIIKLLVTNNLIKYFYTNLT